MDEARAGCAAHLFSSSSCPRADGYYRLGGQTRSFFNYGRMRRDFTYVSRPGASTILATTRPSKCHDVVALLEKELGGQAKVELAPMQSGDVPETKADVDDLMRDVGFRPATPIEEGVRRFAAWYREFHAQN